MDCVAPQECSHETRILAIQPHPSNWRVTHVVAAGRTYTNIARTWREGDSGPGGRCRLCPECTAQDGLCLVSVGMLVPRSSAALFSLRALSGAREVVTPVQVIRDGS